MIRTADPQKVFKISRKQSIKETFTLFSGFSSDAYALCNSNKNIVLTNKAFITLTNYSQNKHEDCLITDFIQFPQNNEYEKNGIDSFLHNEHAFMLKCKKNYKAHGMLSTIILESKEAYFYVFRLRMIIDTEVQDNRNFLLTNEIYHDLKIKNNLLNTANYLLDSKKTELAKTSAELQNIEKHLQQLFKTSNAILFVIDQNLQLVTVNKKALEYLCKDENNIKYIPIKKLISFNNNALNAVNKALNMEKTTDNIETSVIISNKKDITYTMLLSASCFYKNETKFALLTLIDISEQKRLENELLKAKEKAEESDRLKSSFLANLSHEIRTPLNGIIGFVDILVKRNAASHNNKYFLKIIKRCSHQLVQTIEDLLDLSKIETNQVQTKESTFELNKFLIDVLLESQSYEPNFAINCEKSSLPNEYYINTDPMILKKIFMHLIDNALKFSDKEKISFGVLARNETEITFFVKDNGIGIPKNKQQFIFEKFTQLTCKKKLTSGNGLGLFIVNNFAKTIGATLNLISNPLKGTKVTFTIDILDTQNSITA